MQSSGSGRHRKPSLKRPKTKQDIVTAIIVTGMLVAIFVGYFLIYYLFFEDTKITAASVLPDSGENFTPRYPTVALTSVNIDKECGDFFDQDDAQKYYEAQGGPTFDPDDLDLDNDGLACENYNYISTSEVNPK